MIMTCADRAALYGAPVAVVDFETTGLDPKSSRAVSVAVVHLELGKGNAEVVYHTLIEPCIPIPKASSDIHGIVDEMVEGVGSFPEHVDTLLGHLEGRLLCAYNLPYDWQVLNSELSRAGRKPLPWVGLCALVLARYVDACVRGSGQHKLEAVARRRGIEFNAHDAREDALVTGRLLDQLLIDAVSKRGEKFGELREYWAFQRAEAIGQEMSLRRYLQTRGIEREEWAWTDW